MRATQFTKWPTLVLLCGIIGGFSNSAQGEPCEAVCAEDITGIGEEWFYSVSGCEAGESCGDVLDGDPCFGHEDSFESTCSDGTEEPEPTPEDPPVGGICEANCTEDIVTGEWSFDVSGCEADQSCGGVLDGDLCSDYADSFESQCEL